MGRILSLSAKNNRSRPMMFSRLTVAAAPVFWRYRRSGTGSTLGSHSSLLQDVSGSFAGCFRGTLRKIPIVSTHNSRFHSPAQMGMNYPFGVFFGYRIVYLPKLTFCKRLLHRLAQESNPGPRHHSKEHPQFSIRPYY